MNIKLDVEVTPEEMRRFLGLPDFTPLHAELIETLRHNMQTGMKELDSASLMKAWLPLSVSSMETLQKGFWDAFTRPTGGGDSISKT